MTSARSFAPIVRADARVLILGSMPGLRSLAAYQYYAHPRNAFWSIMGALYDAGPELPYADRCARLQGHGIALWDVLESCERPGSLDASIRASSMRANDFASLFQRYPSIHRVCLNGRSAQSSFQRLVLPTLPNSAMDLRALPSSSPAHARMNHTEKLAAWRNALRNS